MEANLKTLGEISIVSISGRLNIEHTQRFKEVCQLNFKTGKVIFNLDNAHFVGSTGISHFIDAVRSVAGSNSNGLKIICKKPEFLRIFGGLDISNVQIHDNEVTAITACVNPASAQLAQVGFTSSEGT